MMKYTSKLAYLLGLPVLVGISMLGVMNMVNGNQITSPSTGDLHRPILHSLFLGPWGNNQTYILLDQVNNRFDIKNGLVMGQDNQLSLGASFVAIGGGSSNYISNTVVQGNSAENVNNSGIGGGIRNVIATESSVIGGGSGNLISCSECGNNQVNVIAGGESNYVANGGAVVGGSYNKIVAPGVIVGGQNNQLQGNGIVLGYGAKGGNGSFSWNNFYPTGNSAAIWASSGVLVGTTDSITGVNLVVDGAMKISTGEGAGIAGEIRMMSGCFYGYDGDIWRLINKNSSDECPRIACAFGSALLQPGDRVDAYEEPYSDNCLSGRIKCNENGILGEEEKNYYPYCYDLGDPSCGDAINQEYVEEPTVGLCLYGEPFYMAESDTGYTWTCKHKDSPVFCSAIRKYDCGPNKPTGYGVSKGSEFYHSGDNPLHTGWTYVGESESNLGVCEWKCAEGYEKDPERNECKLKGSPSCIFSGDSLSGGVTNHFKNIRQASASGQIATLYRTEEEAKQHPCSYICDSDDGRQPVGLGDDIHCAKCLSGTWEEEILGDGSTVVVSCQEIKNICKDGFRYLPETHKCTRLGVCFSGGQVRRNPPEGSDLGQYTGTYRYLPLGDNTGWTYVESADLIQPNSCQYTCKLGYIYSEASHTCTPPSCSGQLPNNQYSQGQSPESYVTYENPVAGNSSRTRVDAVDQKDFNLKVENSGGCYYWCPSGLRCGKNCYSSPQEADEACHPPVDSDIVPPDVGYIVTTNETDPIYTYNCQQGWSPVGIDGDNNIYCCPKGWSHRGNNGKYYCRMENMTQIGTTLSGAYGGCSESTESIDGAEEGYYYYNCTGYFEMDAIRANGIGSCAGNEMYDEIRDVCISGSTIILMSCRTGYILDENNSCRAPRCNNYSSWLTLKGYATNTDKVIGGQDLNYNDRIFTGETGYTCATTSGCCQYCKEGFSGTLLGDKNETICLKKCGAGEYFNLSTYECTSCPTVQDQPDPNSWRYAIGYTDQAHGNPTQCVKKCQDPNLMWQAGTTDDARGFCVPTTDNVNECPAGWITNYVEQQIVCSTGAQTSG